VAIVDKVVAAEKESGKSCCSAMKGDGVGAFTRVVSYINLAAASLESSEHSLDPRDVFDSLPSSPQDVWH
jgi:hypothetical protein